MSKEKHHSRDGFKSRWGFILACIGSAVGMANIWRFPWMLSTYGGLTFLIPYFICVIVIGFTGVITFKNARRALESMKVVPLDRLLIETDCPYMAPEPNRGKRCDSSMLHFVAQKMADELGLTKDEIIRITNENARRLFNAE